MTLQNNLSLIYIHNEQCEWNETKGIEAARNKTEASFIFFSFVLLFICFNTICCKGPQVDAT